ncbi:hypothetical protein E2562_021186, partial [Oryza meyeriana var. granulata]
VRKISIEVMEVSNNSGREGAMVKKDKGRDGKLRPRHQGLTLQTYLPRSLVSNPD